MKPERWQEVKKVLAAALERPPEERSVYLDHTCTDADLRREVESLIAAHENGDTSFMEQPAPNAGAMQSGTKLGPYQILSRLGAGGMGVVYRARDERLERDVAIKVLPTGTLADEAARRRFRTEALALGKLSHPNIAAVYDVGEQNGTDYLVMEFLEGETLAHRVVKGPLPFDQVLQYAIQIADALDKAHRKGVTHRDLKPGNIMLTKSGAKLLDFGLAKLRQEKTTPLSQLTTLEETLTAPGTLVGTLQYMAPEQVEGRAADARTDIFAFGAVMYEMVTGTRAFEGKSQASLIAKILDSDPPSISSLQPMTPPALDRAVKKCLAKEPERRWQDASDLCDELRWISEGSSQAASSGGVSPARGTDVGRRVIFLILGALLIAAVATLATWILKPSPAPVRPVTRFTITLPPGQRLAGLDYPALALSADGNQLAYVATTQDGPQRIYVRAMDGAEARPIPGTEGATTPFFSPDGLWLGFVADKKLKKIPISGGVVQILSDVVDPYGASWGSQGTIVFTPTVGPIQQVSDTGGALQPLTHLEKGEINNAFPEILPGGKGVLFNYSQPVGIAVQALGTGGRRNLLQGHDETAPVYAPSGHLVYAQDGTLMAVLFDLERLKVRGGSVPVVQGVLQAQGLPGPAQYSVSATGSLVYIPSSTLATLAVQSRMVWVSRNGKEQPLAAPGRNYDTPRLSPDGRQVAVNDLSELDLYDLGRDTLARFTSGGFYPAWTPDGKRIAFGSDKEGSYKVYWQMADGSGGLEQLTTGANPQFPISWSPDGQLLAFDELAPATGVDIWTLRIGDPSASSGQGRKAQPVLQTPAWETAPQFSPDGHWLAYVSDESGRKEVYVQPYPGPGGKWLISTEGGTEPLWNRNGRELFYRNGDKMMAVDISTRAGFVAGKPRQLFEGHYLLNQFALTNYDVSADGQRFLMLKPVEEEQTASTQINVVLNWTEELKRLVPSGK